MAYGKKYDIDYKSMANEDFTLEIWVDGFSGSSTEINLGSSGPEIKYETSNQQKFSYILSSSMEIPFIVENIGMQDFIDDLRDGTLQEKDVYAHLFNSRDSVRPLWSGFILMDLSAREDVSMPYEVKLTAVDGLSLLKDRPFVRETNVDTGLDVEFPYNKGDVYWNNYDKITDWIQIILSKTGSATTSEGLSSGASYTYKTSINWYNAEMPSTGQADDPLFWTQCKMNSLYTRNEDGNYTPKSTYDVLESLCKSWGMRCVYWHHTFHFVQIAEYDVAESGTPAAPINIATREYFYTGGVRSDEAHIGELDFGRYDLQFENVTDPSYGLQKLSGTKYDHYAPIKRVIGNFNVVADENRYFGFPALDQTTTLFDIIKSSEISTYTDAANGSGWFCQIPLIFTNIKGRRIGSSVPIPRVVDMRVCFSIRAKQSGAGSWGKMLTENGGVLSWSTYTAPTSVNGVPNDMINASVVNIPIGTSQRIVWTSSGYANGVIPTDAAFTGDWEFEFFTYTDGETTTDIIYHGDCNDSTSWTHDLYRPGSTDTTFDYSDPVDSDGQYLGVFAAVSGGSIGDNTIKSEYKTSTTDSYTIEIKDLYWGDSSLTDIGSTLRVWDGTNFVNTETTGEWGKGTLSGTDSFVELLANEIMKCQDEASFRMSVSSALSETNKENSGKLKMVNPIGRLKDVDSRKYVFLSGTFSTTKDEWNGVWFQMTYDNGLVVTTADENQTGIISGPVTGGGSQGSGMGSGSQQMRIPWGATSISRRDASGSVTELEIDAIGTAIFKDGDRIFVTDNKSGQGIDFIVSADQGESDTTISVEEKTITYDIREGSIVGIDFENLIQQYQRKTEGTIAGMPVDEDSIGKYSIKGGNYYMVGVDTLYVKILPSDFMVNDDASSPDITPAVFGDGTNTGVSVENTSQELIATVNIPSGTTATEVYIWGSNTTKSVEVYEMDINANGKGSTIGTGVTDGTAISIGTIASSDTNYLMIKVLVSSTNHRIWGGKVTLTQN